MERKHPADTPSRTEAQIIARRRPIRVITGPTAGMKARLTTPNAAITRPMLRAPAW